jgi:hypothetical protein
MKGYIQDKEFGKVYVELRRGMTSVRFTYHPDGHLLMRAPLGASATQLQQMVDINREQLHQLPRPQAISFDYGQVMECFRCRVVIEPTNPRPGYLKTEWDDDNVLHVTMHESTDLDEYSAKQYISDRISEAMGYIANKELLPFARETAVALGLKPAGFEIGRGMRKLGHCTAKRVIQLSRNLMFLPEPLVHYIICHELAHLTHMNHSPEFHALVDEYTDGREQELEQQLRQFRWPIAK